MSNDIIMWSDKLKPESILLWKIQFVKNMFKLITSTSICYLLCKIYKTNNENYFYSYFWDYNIIISCLPFFFYLETFPHIPINLLQIQCPLFLTWKIIFISYISWVNIVFMVWKFRFNLNHIIQNRVKWYISLLLKLY